MNPKGVNIPAGGTYDLGGSWTSNGVVDGCVQFTASADGASATVKDKDGMTKLLEVTGLKGGSIVRICGTMLHVVPA